MPPDFNINGNFILYCIGHIQLYKTNKTWWLSLFQAISCHLIFDGILFTKWNHDFKINILVPAKDICIYTFYIVKAVFQVRLTRFNSVSQRSPKHCKQSGLLPGSLWQIKLFAKMQCITGFLYNEIGNLYIYIIASFDLHVYKNGVNISDNFTVMSV